MTNAALRGKPDAGNPHVRFDEGEVASATTPRRGSLLYNKVKKFVCDVARIAASVHLFAALAIMSATAAFAGTTGLYVQDGLIACWDGIENAGVGQHNDSPSAWVDLVGGLEITIPSWVTTESNGFYSESSTATRTYPTISSIPGLGDNVTIEVVAERVRWRATDNYNNLQPVINSPYGGFGYRHDKTSGVYYYLPIKTANKCDLYSLDSNSGGFAVSEIHTYAARVTLPYNASNAIVVDGKAVSGFSDSSYSGSLPSKWTFFSAPRADIRIHAIRVYNRKLTSVEISANQTIDKIRFTYGADTCLQVMGSPANFGSPSPAYGVTNGLAAGASFTVSCGATPVTNNAESVVYSCTGWKLYNENDEVVSNGVETSFTYTHPSPAEFRRLEWQWSYRPFGRLAFTENYTPPAADSSKYLFIHIDASKFGTMSYDADANGDLRLASIADPRGNGLYASNSMAQTGQAPYNKAKILPCALNGRSVLDLGPYNSYAAAADLRWCYNGAFKNCGNEVAFAIVYANRDEGIYADPASDYNAANATWQSGGEYTLFSTNAPKAHENLQNAAFISIDGVQRSNTAGPYPSGYHVMYVVNKGPAWPLPLHGIGAYRNMRQGAMLVAEAYVFTNNTCTTPLTDAQRNALITHLKKKWGIGDGEHYAPPALSGITASMNANGLESLALAGGALAPGNGGTATISVPAGFTPRAGDYPLLTGANLSDSAEAALETWTVDFSPAIEAKAKLAVVNGDVVLRVLPRGMMLIVW